MKLLYMALMSMALFALLLTNAEASNRQVGGLIIGGGTGALVGNAVGQNAESTIIGATVGGVLGFMIGNELDRHHGSVNDPLVVTQSKKHYKRHYKRHYNHRHYDRHRPSFKKHNRHYNFKKYRHRDYPRYHPYSGKCRKIVTIYKGHNKTKRVVSTVCGNRHRNPNIRDHHYRYNDRHYDRYYR